MNIELDRIKKLLDIMDLSFGVIIKQAMKLWLKLRKNVLDTLLQRT